MRAVTADHLETRVVFLSEFVEGASVYKAVAAGAFGCISKDLVPAEICDSIVAVAAGRTVLGSESQDAIGVEIRKHPRRSTLSQRECEVLRLTADGFSSNQIAELLILSPATIKTHLRRLYHKLAVSDRAAAVAQGIRTGLIE